MTKKKKYDSEDGIWRTVGGRRIFIKNGQDLSSAMKESGKFKNMRKDIQDNVKFKDMKEDTIKRQGVTAKEYQRAEDNVAQLKKERNALEIEVGEYDDDDMMRGSPAHDEAKWALQVKEEELSEATKKYDKLMEKDGHIERKYKMPTKNEEYELYKRAKENPDSIDPMTENSTDWEALDKKYGNRYKEEYIRTKKYPDDPNSHEYTSVLRNTDEYQSKVFGTDVTKLDKQMKDLFGKDFKYDEEKTPLENSYWNNGGKYKEYANYLAGKDDQELIEVRGIPENLVKQYRDEGKRYYRWFNDGDKPHRKTLDGKTYTSGEYLRRIGSSDERNYWENVYAKDMDTRMNSILEKMQNAEIKNGFKTGQINKPIQLRYSETLKNLRETTNMSPGEILELLKKIDENRK